VVRGASAQLYDALAPDYDAHFAAPHRRAYDDLAWELIGTLLPPQPGVIVDVGCGSGRWAARLVGLGHHVIGVEPSPVMAAAARRRLGGRLELVQQPMEEVVLPAGCADLVLAMGSLQYADDPDLMLARLAGWVRPGGHVAVLVDSLVALAGELLAVGRQQEAFACLRTRQGRWVQEGLAADLHLFDAARLRRGLAAAQLQNPRVCGLLVGWSVLGRAAVLARLAAAAPAHLAWERRLASEPLMADLGKQLYGTGQVPVSVRSG
jgi:SAM-dependent methyltransferase